MLGRLIVLGCLGLFLAMPGFSSAASTGVEPRGQGLNTAEQNGKAWSLVPRAYHRKDEDLVRATGKDCRDCHVRRCYPQRDFLGWESEKKWRIHWTLFSVSMFIMLSGVYSAVLIWQKGRRPSLHHPVHWPSVRHALVHEVILGDRIRRQSRVRWAVFELISIAFVALAIVFCLIVIQRFVLPSWLPGLGAAGLILEFFADLLGGLILLGILLALYRRLGRKEARLQTVGEDLVLLFLLLGIVVTGFFLESCRLAVVAPEPRIWASFLGAAGAVVLKGWPLPWASIRLYAWIVHAGLVFALFAYLPFSKLFHAVTAPVSILATASEAHYKQRQ